MNKKANELGQSHILRWIFALLLVVLYVPQVMGQEVPALVLKKPVEGAIFAETVPPTFVWESSQFTEFKVQFSSDINFPQNNTFNLTRRWIAAQSVTPTNAAWRRLNGEKRPGTSFIGEFWLEPGVTLM